MTTTSKINLNELAEALELGKESVRRFRKEGLPCTKVNGKLAFDVEEVFAWFVSTGRHKHAGRITKLRVNPDKPVREVTGAIDDLDAFVERVRFNECALHEDVQNAVDAAMRGYAYGNYKDACKQRLDVEKEISRIQMSQQLSVAVEDVERQFAELGSLVKSKLMSWIAKLPPLLEEKSMAQMSEVLEDEVREVLEDLSR